MGRGVKRWGGERGEGRQEGEEPAQAAYLHH